MVNPLYAIQAPRERSMSEVHLGWFHQKQLLAGEHIMARHAFTLEVKSILAQRVGMRCSNPNCRQLTSSPQDDPTKTVNVGVAAHITAASKGGPRYDPSLSKEERCSIENGMTYLVART
jgi:hypothetical protein